MESEFLENFLVPVNVSQGSLLLSLVFVVDAGAITKCAGNASYKKIRMPMDWF